MSIWTRLAKEKVHFFWTLPIVNAMLNVVNSSGIIYLVLKAGRPEAILVIPFVIASWVVLWLVGRQKVMREEVSYNWTLAKPWLHHERETIAMMERLDRIEAKIEELSARRTNP